MSVESIDVGGFHEHLNRVFNYWIGTGDRSDGERRLRRFSLGFEAVAAPHRDRIWHPPRAQKGPSGSGRRASRRGRQELPSKLFRQVEHHVMAALHGDRPPALCFCLVTRMWKR